MSKNRKNKTTTKVDTAKTKPRSKSSKILLTIASIGVIGGLVLPGLVQPVMERFAPVSAYEGVDVDTSTIQAMTLGAPDAPVEIVEYASFTCSHCATFSNDILRKLKTDFIDKGLVKITTKEVYTHPSGLWASMIARCDNGSKYHAISDEVFADFNIWTSAQSGQAMMGMLKAIGVDAGLDGSAIDACMEDETKAATLYNWSKENMDADDVRGTPTVLINGDRGTSHDYAKLTSEIEAALAKVK